MNEDSNKQKIDSRWVCCVNSCRNTYKNSKCHFYRFPNAKWHIPRRVKWIQAVNRKNSDGSPWAPNSQSVICSCHFIGGEKSDDRSSPAFIPTLNLGTPRSDVKAKRQRRKKRFKNGTAAREHCQDVNHLENNDDDKALVAARLATFCHIGIQVDLEHKDSNAPAFMLCNRQDNCAEIQVSLPCNLPTSDRPIQDDMPRRSERRNARTKISEEVGFTGFSSITEEETLQELAGMTFDVFRFLCNFLSTERQVNLCKENRLLLFLMKMKLGLQYSALATLFQVPQTTASAVFRETLSELYVHTKSSIFWPDAVIIKQTMPQCFKMHYPDCTAIIDCAEFLCDKPKEVRQQVVMFSCNYKPVYSLRYLIAISPAGYISFVSRGFGGCSTDGYIAANSGILKHIKPGDQIMVDKECPQIKSNLEAKGALFVMPPVAHSNGTPFTAEEYDDAYFIASVRIHVEHVIQHWRRQGILAHFTLDLIPDADKIVTMAAVLANLQSPIIS